MSSNLGTQRDLDRSASRAPDRPVAIELPPLDLPVLIRVLWRARFKIAAVAVLLATFMVGAGRLLLAPKMAAATDVAVFPPPDLLDSSAASVYPLQPDRFVATQIQILTSRAVADLAAQKMGVSTAALLSMIKVHQAGKSDVLEVVGTATTPALAIAASTATAQAYVDFVTATTGHSYDDAVASIDDQRASIQGQVAQVRQQISNLGQSTTDPGSLQANLNDLLSQDAALSTKREELVTNRRYDTSVTKIVSVARTAQPAGITTKKLVIYGAFLGLAIGAAQVALVAGRSLEGMVGLDEVGGIPLLGLVERKRRWLDFVLPRRRRDRDLRTGRVASELRSFIRVAGPLAIVPVGREARVDRSVRALRRHFPTAGEPGDDRGLHAPTGADLAVTPVDAVLREELAPGAIAVLGVDTASLARELADTVGLLRAAGVDIVGVFAVP